MNVHAQPAVTMAAPGVEVSNGVEGMSAICAPDCSAVLCQRVPPPGFQAWIDALDPTALPAARVILRASGVAEATTEICNAAGLRDGPERAWLIKDIAGLADRFAAVIKTDWLRLRLAVVTTNSCRKFHIDAVTARLICTYRGPGTEFGIAEIGGTPDPAFAVPTGSPFVLRGTLWPTAQRPGLLHRSPPIEGSGTARLVLVLDPVDDPDAAFELH